MPTQARIEGHAWLDLIATADRVASRAAGLSVIRVGNAIAVRSRSAGPLVNYTYQAPADEVALRVLRAHYEQAGVARYFIKVDHPDHDHGHRTATAAGLVPHRRRMVHLVRKAGRVQRVSTAFDIGRAKVTETLSAASILCASFDMDATMAPVLASLFGSPRWQFVVARAGHDVVGAGLLYLDGETGYLHGGATVPRFRGMGAQQALIAARLEIAQERGCREVAAHTGEEVAGEPQHSYRNMLRHGFAPVGRTTVYAAPAPIEAGAS